MRTASLLILAILFLSLIPSAASTVATSGRDGVGINPAGFRLDSWELEGVNVIGAGERGALGQSYPLWDWLLSEPWPGNLATGEYEISENEGIIKGTLQDGSLLVEKRFQVLDSNRALLDVTFTNTGNSTFKSLVSWDSFDLGYAMAWAGYLGKPGGEQEIWMENGQLHIEEKNWVRLGAKVEAFGLVDFDEDLIALVFPSEESVALWLETGSWGVETRAELAPLILKPGESKTYVFGVFVGHIGDLKEAYPEVYEKLTPFIEKERFEITFELPTFPIVGETTNITVAITPREPLNKTGNLLISIACGENSFEEAYPVDLRGESGVSIQVKAEKSCRIKAELELEGEIIASASTTMRAFEKGKPLKVVFVWHHHQSPGVWPNGTLHGPWTLVHTYEDELEPYYDGGAYYFHAWILQKYPEIKMTYHLSPSLLWQWNLTNTGWCQSYPSYQCFTPESPEAEKVREAMRLYRDLYERGQIEILSSYFAHPISGYIAERYGWFDILDYELSLGKRTTEEIMGVNASGMWLPEMAFSPKLVPLLERHGVRYTVLDDRCHLNVLYPYSPYHVYGIENSSIRVLFRDHTISDDFAFNNNFRSEDDAREKARKIVEEILNVRNVNPSAEVVTIAADGENWIIFSPNPGLTAKYFEYLLQYLQEAQEKGLIKTVTFGEAVNELQPYRNITPLTTSWLCSWDKWTKEKASVQSPMWERDEEVYNLTREYLENCGRDEIYKKALYGLAQALDSDFYWAEFSYPPHVYAWLNWTENLVKDGLKGCGSTNVTPTTMTTTTSAATLHDATSATETHSTSETGESNGFSICGVGALSVLSLLILLLRKKE
ncbi:glycoside hydrolase family 57 protein [Thermococcus sp. CX2]|uniref:glycoside hydrolase family 57 protein n=1 Tax=Thermococcus sp. CX2 TaxID=163006 RepID=UPI00143A3FE3|nr:glycoside hydrolase family 57 protein [Thermococcus sp. CX2]